MENHNVSSLNEQLQHQEHHHYESYDNIWIDLPIISFKINDDIWKIASTNF